MGIRKKSEILRLAAVFALFVVITQYIGQACGPAKTGPDYVDLSCSPTARVTVSSSPASNEPAYCTLNASFSNPLTVTGHAEFNVLSISGSILTPEVLGGPIAYAEVNVVDGGGNVLQCGETDGNGDFSLLVPRNQTLSVKINSRSYNSHLRASVLNSPSSDQFYSLVTPSFSTATAAGSLNIGTTTASAKGDVLGGAFNILFNLLRANESLRYFACGDNNSSCAGFSMAPKVIAYWAKGVNPYVYFGGPATSGLSFYVPGSDRLYILGGINGDVDSSDTDHFDDPVISHEYGHFIEDHYARTDSPGGSHDGNHILDARLTWGEGWANFFSSAVRANRFYRDCYGTQDGTTGCYFNYDIDRNSNFGVKLDVPVADGEGNFREFAITRGLWDAVDPIRNIAGGVAGGVNGGVTDDNSTDNVTENFNTFWNTFNGFASSNLHFRNVGLFLGLNADSVLNSSSVLPAEKIKATSADYAQPLPTTTGPSCVGTSISILANDVSSCTFGGATVCTRGTLNHCCSNQLASNDFYDVNYDGSFSSISLQRISGDAELNLYLYNEGYTFGNQCDMAKVSSVGGGASKQISLAGLPYGHYILNVNVYTGNGNPSAASNYQLFVNGSQVCP